MYKVTNTSLKNLGRFSIVFLRVHIKKVLFKAEVLTVLVELCNRTNIFLSPYSLREK